MGDTGVGTACARQLHSRVAASMVGVAAVDFCTRLLDAVENGSPWKQFKNMAGGVLRTVNAAVNPLRRFKNGGYNPHYANDKIAKKLAKKTKDLLAERDADQYCQAAVAGIENASLAALELVNEKPLGADDTQGPDRLNLMNTLQGQPNTTWQHSLRHVCKEEGSDIFREVKKEAEEIFVEQLGHTHPLQELCAHFVVRKVESKVLGRCAYQCGWNNKTCTLWPFVDGAERDSWKSECCSEYSAIRFSEREKMCNSVLPPGDDRKLLEEHDKEPWIQASRLRLAKIRC